MIEIERKFLVKNNSFLSDISTSNRIVQGYLNSNPERAVRVRIKGENGYITIKGKGNATGMSRFEWEKEISHEEAEQLLLLCEAGVIDKTRYEVLNGTFVFEVDVFHGENEGLVLAEIELNTESDVFTIPNWLGEEVTNNKQYYNSYLSKHPFEKW